MDLLELIKNVLITRENLLVNIQGVNKNYSIQSIDGINDKYIIVSENNGQHTIINLDKIESLTIETFRDEENKPEYYYDNVFITSLEEIEKLIKGE